MRNVTFSIFVDYSLFKPKQRLSLRISLNYFRDYELFKSGWSHHYGCGLIEDGHLYYPRNFGSAGVAGGVLWVLFEKVGGANFWGCGQVEYV